MPEFPEVEVISHRLRDIFKGHRIDHIDILSKKVIRSPSVKEFLSSALGRRVVDIFRRAKFLLLRLDSDKVILVHLKINGQIVVFNKRPAKVPKFAKIGFVFEKAGSFFVCDSRSLVEIRLVDGGLISDIFRDFGPEPLSSEFTFEYLEEVLKNRRAKIKPLIMDQKIISGLGNIYANEALFRAGIRPDRLANTLSKQEIHRLYTAIRELILESVENGAVLEKYYSDGKKWPSFSEKLCVYNRENKPCPVCKSKVKKILLAGRGTYFCESCQV